MPRAGGGGGNPAAHWRDIVDQIDHSHLPNAMSLATKLRMQIRVVSLEPGKLEYTQPKNFDEDMAPELRQAFQQVFGTKWEIAKVDGEGALTLVEQDEALRKAEKDRIRNHPLVEAAFAAFPDAQLIEDQEPARGREDWSRSA